MTQGKLARTGLGFLSCGVLLPAALWGQNNWQPAIDVLGQEDLWGNPTFIGGVANGGPGGHSIW